MRQPDRRAQGLLADHAILQYLDDLLQPAYCATGTVVDGSVEHQESERSRQAIAGDPLPIVSLVERLRRIEREIGDIRVGGSNPSAATVHCCPITSNQLCNSNALPGVRLATMRLGLSATIRCHSPLSDLQ